jgi:hypothetical protein
MMRLSITTLALSAASMSAVMAQDSTAFVGTWTGRTITGQTVQIEIPAGVTQGQPVVYILNGQHRGTGSSRDGGSHPPEQLRTELYLLGR